MIHILFSPSAAGTLRQALRSRGIRDRVVDLTEWLDWGWIASDRVADRLRWFEEIAGFDWAWLAECHSKFLTEVAADEDWLTWIAPRSAQEQCGLFWFMHHSENPPSQIIVADYPLLGSRRGGIPQSLGELGPDLMGQLLDSGPRHEWDSWRFPRDKWSLLMDDAAVLRVTENDVLQSAPSDHYDQWILSWCPSDWTKWSRVVGNAMAHADQPISDLFLRWRLQKLIESGTIECNGELPAWDHPQPTEPARLRRVA
ncbi:MAG TPA: DUF3658 domain-containing protein [Sphingomicrobium sp.]